MIVPVLEPDAEFERCIHCIEGALQGLTPAEILVVAPARFAASLAASLPQVRVVIETRRGIYSAMNDGAAASRGDYLYFIGKDDMLLPTARAAIDILERERPFALFCDVYWGSSGIYSGKPSRVALLARNLCHQGIVYSREAFIRHGPYLRRMRVQADHLLNIKVLWDRSAASRIRYLAAPLAWYSGDGFSTLHRDRTFWRLYPAVMRRYVGTWAMHALNGYRALRGANRRYRRKP